MCGFMNSILVTTPASVTGFFWSNSTANPWCARTGAEALNRRKARRHPADEIILIAASPAGQSELASLYIEGHVRSSGMILPCLCRVARRGGQASRLYGLISPLQMRTGQRACPTLPTVFLAHSRKDS